jgi:hypothetical protein
MYCYLTFYRYRNYGWCDYITTITIPTKITSLLQYVKPTVANDKVTGNDEQNGRDAPARGVPQIEVTFDIDANGIIKV